MSVKDVAKTLKDGDKVLFTPFSEKSLKEGMVTEEDGSLYICQNYFDGAICFDKKGYQYSWIIGTKRSPSSSQIGHIKKMTEENQLLLALD